MRLLLTGLGGTVAPRLAALAANRGHDVVGWDRSRVPPEDGDAGRRFLEHVRPDAIVHLAFGAEAWASLLAGVAAERSLPFVYTSSAMVFAQRPDGPYSTAAPTTADTEYGQYKARCELAVRSAYSGAMVVRLAYQMDLGTGGNQLVAHLDAAHARGERIPASTVWIPAVAFLDDTAAGLLSFVVDPEPGVHHLDGNATVGWSYHRVVVALAGHLQRGWRIDATDVPIHDQRLLGSARISPIDMRLR